MFESFKRKRRRHDKVQGESNKKEKVEQEIEDQLNIRPKFGASSEYNIVGTHHRNLSYKNKRL